MLTQYLTVYYCIYMCEYNKMVIELNNFSNAKVQIYD